METDGMARMKSKSEDPTSGAFPLEHVAVGPNLRACLPVHFVWSSKVPWFSQPCDVFLGRGFLAQP